ncbi:barstar family protein [Luteimonas terrae]|uniref:RNAse (Barnase) inhibitor barstar n=1 Tax=Luteimonas terrae TaxID=1530191 RepID=A0ABU1XVD7_9GAMM|nr:barstar family protein [Luteimonas terrae]MDR7192041.1 RNAse (barnase) inhibitor barstar [Luteimonas terrae]
MSQSLSLDGSRIHDLASFYDEVNRVFMADADWSLGHSLDALDDMLYGGYGALDGNAPVTLVWTDFERNRHALGVDATRAWLQDKLDTPGRYDKARMRRDIDALEAGSGPTFFDLVLEILAAHPNITLDAR